MLLQKKFAMYEGVQKWEKKKKRKNTNVLVRGRVWSMKKEQKISLIILSRIIYNMITQDT